MAYLVELPDGRAVEFEDSVPKEEAARIIRQQLGMEMPGAQKRTGAGAALATGFEGLVDPTITAGQAAFGDANKAAEDALKRAANSPYASQVSWDKVKEKFNTEGVLAAAAEVARQAPLALLEQAPQLAATLGGAYAGAKAGALTSPVTGPVGPIAGGVLGAAAATAPAMFGSNIIRQAAEQQERGEAVDVNVPAAAGTAAVQTALESAATFIPLGRRVVRGVFGPQVDALFKQGKKEAAEALARESLAKTLGKGVALGVAVEAPTEVVQSALERLQAGLPLLDEDALREYGESAYAGALVGGPLGAAGRAYGRSGARAEAREQEEAAAAEQRRVAARVEQEQREAPDYILTLNDEYQKLLTQKNALESQRKKGTGAAPLTQEDKDNNELINRQLAEIKDPLAQARKAFNDAGGPPALKKVQDARRTAALSPQEAFLESLGVSAAKPTPAAEAASIEEAALESAAATAPSALQRYAQNRISLANEQTFGTATAKDYVDYLLERPSLAQKLVDENQQLPGIESKKLSNSVLSGLRLALTERKKQAAKGRPLEGTPLSQLEAEEAAALEDVSREEAARLAETEERRKLGPELTALQRMRARRLPESVREEPYIEAVAERAARAAPAPEPQPSAAVGQMQQLLTGQDVTYTAEEPKARQLRRVPTEGLTLFGESQREAEAAPAKTPDPKQLRERINRALLNPNLSDEAYDLLRRAEDLMPDVETRIATRRATTEGRTREDVAQTAGLLELLDQQLTRIERGQEGVPTAGRTLVRDAARRPALGASVVSPSEATKDDIRLRRQQTYADLVAQGFSPGAAAKRAFQIGKPTAQAQEGALTRFDVPQQPQRPEAQAEVTRKVPGRITPMEPRAAREMAPGPEAARQPGRQLAQEPRRGTIRGRGAPLSLAAEIEPLLQMQERARAEDAGQQVLFPELERERGTIASTPEAFRRRLDRLKAVKDGYARELLRKEAAVQPLEQEIRELGATLDEYQRQQKALQDAQFVLRNNEALLKELRVTGAGTEKLSGGIGALTVSENTFQQAADALNRQRVLLLNYAEQRRREKEAAPKLKTKDFAEISKLLEVQASDDARLANALASIEAEVERINAFEKDVYKQFPRIERAKEAARERMRDLHRRYGTASEFLDGLKTLRGKIDRQLQTAKDSYRKDPYNEELRELVFELFQQTREIDSRIDRNKKLMSKISAQVDVAVAEANINRLKAEAPAGAVKKAADALADAKRRLQTLRSDLAKAQPKPAATPVEEKERPASAVAEGPLQEVISYSANLNRHQRMLEAMQLRTKTGTIVPALSYAQRLARESGAEVTFSVDDLALLDKDPKRVLNGLVSRATDLENKIKKAVANSRGAVLRGEVELINRYKQLVQDYENAESSLERSQIEPELDLVAKEYDAALNESLAKRVVWKGQKRDTAELLNLYQKIAYLEERFFLPQATEKRTYRPETEAEIAEREREAAAIFESQREAQAGAGTTSGEALTRSQVAKRRKAQKTLYSSKGVTAQEELSNEALIENAKAYATAQEVALLRSALEKRDRLESLTDLEQFAYNSAVEANRPSFADFEPLADVVQKERKGARKRGAALSEEGALPEEALDVIAEGRDIEEEVKAEEAAEKEFEQRVLYSESAATETTPEKKSVGRGFSKKEMQKANDISRLFREIKAAEAELQAEAQKSLENKTLLADRKPLLDRRKKVEALRSELQRLLKKEKTVADDEGDVELSRGVTTTPSTTATVRAELGKVFPDLGRVQIYDSVDALVQANPQYKGRIPADARGFVDSAGNKAFLIAENIDQGRALGVLLHEVGSHIGLKNTLGEAQYNALVKAVQTWAKKTDGSPEAKVAQAALARVEAAQTPASQRADETLAYAIEEAVNAGVKPLETKSVLGQWLSRVAQLFRRALEKFGLPPKAFDAQGLVDMAFGAAKMEMRGMRPEGATNPVQQRMYHGSPDTGINALTGLVFYTPSREVAKQYADNQVFGTGRGASGTGRVYEETVSTKNTLDMRKQEHRAAYEEARKKWNATADLDDRLPPLTSEGFVSTKTGVPSFGYAQRLLAAMPEFDSVWLDEGAQGLSLAVQKPDEVLFSRKTDYAPGLAAAGKVSEQLVGGQRSFVDKVKANLLGFRAQVVDKLAPLEKVAYANMDDMKASQLMFYMRMYDQRNHFTSESLATGVPERKEIIRADGRKEFVIESKPGANIKKIVDRLSTKAVVKEAGSVDAANRLFTLYTAAKRADRVGYQKLGFGRAAAEAELRQIDADRRSPTLDPNDRKRLLQRKDYLEKNAAQMPSEADIRAAVKEIEANKTLRDAFEDAREMYNEYNRNLLNFAVQAGTISDAEAKRLLAAKDYVPYHRVRGGNAELVIGGENPIRIGNLKDNPQLEELVGGEEPIFDFLTSSVQNTSMLLDMSLRNLAVKNAMHELRDVGLAKVYSVRNEKGKRRSVPDNAVKFRVKGDDWFAIVNTDAAGVPSDLLVKGLAGIPTMLPAVVRMMAVPARVLRRAIVASPVYVARQVVRDSVSAALASGANMTPILSSLRKIRKKGALDARGVTGGQVFTGMPEDMARLLREMQTGRPGWAKAWSQMERFAMEADAATRRAQYDSYREQGLSEMEATLASLESMNFSRRGLSPSVHFANAIIPFFNAQIQGLDVLYRSLRGQMPFNKRLDIRNKLLQRGALLFMTSLAYAASMQDEEEYKNARPDEKYGNWFVRMPFLDEYADEPVVVRVPIPFELGYIFKALPEALVNTMASEEGGKEALQALKQIVINTIPGGSSMPQLGGVPVPIPLPAAAKPVIEAGLGRSFFTGRDIESMQEQQREPGERFRDGTSEVAKAIGQTFNVSPIKLEYLIRGYTGSLGVALVQSLNFLTPAPEGSEKALRRLSELPVVGTVFQPMDAGGIIDATYARVNEIRQAQETYENMITTGRTADAQAYLERKADELALASVAGDFRKRMGDVTKAERAIRDAPSLSAQEKRERLNELRQVKIQIASAARAIFDRKTPQAAPA